MTVKDSVNKLLKDIDHFYANSADEAKNLTDDSLKEYQFLTSEIIKLKEAAETFLKRN